jgi:hypothetical protein
LAEPVLHSRASLRVRGLLLAWLVVMAVGRADAQVTLSPEEELEQEFTDPLTALPQVIARDSYTPVNYGVNLATNQFIIRPIIPRIPPNALLPFVQLIRPTFALVTTPSSRGGTRTEFGDLPVFDLAVLPWRRLQDEGLLVGLGVTFVFPTATSRSAGEGAWQAGPAAGAIYTGVRGLLAGFVVQNPISFAYTSAGRAAQNTLEFQPVLALHLWRNWYLVGAAIHRRYCRSAWASAVSCFVRVAADELFRYRTVDSLPTIRSDRATDDDQFRVDAWLSGVDELVGVSGTYRARCRQVAVGTPWKE